MADQQIDRVTAGKWVRVTGFDPGEDEVFHIVSEAEADVAENRIPPSSPLARVLSGAKAGDKIAFSPPGGEVELTVLEVGKD